MLDSASTKTVVVVPELGRDAANWSPSFFDLIVYAFGQFYDRVRKHILHVKLLISLGLSTPPCSIFGMSV